MRSAYDWICLAIFAGLVVLFLERSMKRDDDDKSDSIFLYLAAGVGCAVTNYLGNEGQHAIAIAALAATVAFIFCYLQPFRSNSA
jgi:hypothetical protein